MRCSWFVMCTLWIFSCSTIEPEPKHETERIDIELEGAVSKGPFVVGSGVTVSLLDEQGHTTGDVFTAQTRNDLGEFDLHLEVERDVSLAATGFYYNEVTGQLSEANITLRALHSFTQAGQQSAYINVITHLAFNRAERLHREGQLLTEAVLAAEQELRAALPIGQGWEPGITGIEINMLQGDQEPAAFLFALSTLLAGAAQDQGGPVAAALQELLNTVALDLEDDGQLEAGMIEQLRTAQASVDIMDVMRKYRARLDQLGSEAEVPDLSLFLDSDLDGYSNATDNCPNAANADQSDADHDEIGDVCDCEPECIDFTYCDSGTLTCMSGCAQDTQCNQGQHCEPETHRCICTAGPGACSYPGDWDGDNWLDGNDNCPLLHNPNQSDGDGDGRGDLCDNCPYQANPNQLDLN